MDPSESLEIIAVYIAQNEAVVVVVGCSNGESFFWETRCIFHTFIPGICFSK